jgi:hypothetical protein
MEHPAETLVDAGNGALSVQASPHVARLLSLCRDMRITRRVDEIEAELTSSATAFFYVGCTGHEGIAVLG